MVVSDGRAAETIRVWSHQGQEAESRALRKIAAVFNEVNRGRGWSVELTFFPDFQYTEKLAVAAAAGDLPDAFDLDGPLVARFVEAGLLADVSEVYPREELADFLPTIIEQGTIGGRLYALGSFDSALLLYYDREMLARADVSAPAEGKGWSWAEFVDACEKLKAAGMEPVGLHMNESADEWFTYAFSPVVWSGGGELIDVEARRVRGVLASEENVRSVRAWQGLFARGFAATDPVEPDPFGQGKTAMDWSGHWMARSHLKAKGERLGAMPLPMLAEPSAPCGSWCWAISARTEKRAVAEAWLRWVTGVKTGVVPTVRANGAVPSRRSAFAHFPEYSEIPYRIFREQLETSARARPRTAFYATLTQRFAAALRDISRGADVEARLRKAEDEVQRVIDRKTRSVAEVAR
ncbi:ABC transporter substrate-binding protein [Nibricoccus aquaticus]|uniref:ABC transporter substrate-binding protein n=1 Tax=Nibricoccus aquaticus TaxID=2576891 RepID=UPI001FE4D259|nr:sugar ABC transporter substrate-binding protein [Nibricoccus aquaticus]